jgi:hypothetical protein
VTKLCKTCTTRAKTGKFSVSQAGSGESIFNGGDDNDDEDEENEAPEVDLDNDTSNIGGKRTY